MPYAIGGAVIAELISANRGLGYLVQLSAMNFDTTGVFVALVMVTCIAFLGNWMVNMAERRLLRWRPPADGSVCREGPGRRTTPPVRPSGWCGRANSSSE